MALVTALTALVAAMVLVTGVEGTSPVFLAGSVVLLVLLALVLGDLRREERERREAHHARRREAQNRRLAAS